MRNIASDLPKYVLDVIHILCCSLNIPEPDKNIPDQVPFDLLS